ncbi:MAG: hypothetical protein EA357_07935 [Micavibrio sp.]|nr:MAG: hypothetical protein EA357_07935 [Micavibrio sp.]
MSTAVEGKKMQGAAAFGKALAVTAFWICCFALLLGVAYWQRHTLAHHLIISQLHKNGFPEARIERLAIDFSTLKIDGLTLSPDMSAGHIVAEYRITPQKPKKIRITRLALDEVAYRHDLTAAPAAETDTAIEDIIRDAVLQLLPLPLDKAVISSTRIHLHGVPFALISEIRADNTEIYIKKETKSIDIKSQISTDGAAISFAAHIETELYANGDAALRLFLSDGAALNLGDADAEGLQGEARIFLRDGLPVIEELQFLASKVTFFGLPFENIIFSYAEDTPDSGGEPEKKTVLLQMQNPESRTKISAFVTIGNDTDIQGEIEIQSADMEKLQQLGAAEFDLLPDTAFNALQNIRLGGNARLSLKFSGRKHFENLHNIAEDWEEFAGKLEFSTQNFSALPYFSGTNAEIGAHFSPAAEGIAVFPEKMSLSGKDSGGTAFVFALDPAPDTTHILLKNRGTTADFRLPKLSLSYGGLLNFNGGITGKLFHTPNPGFHLHEVDGRAVLPDHKITADIYEADITGDFSADKRIKADIRAGIEIEDSPLVPFQAHAKAVYDRTENISFDVTLSDHAQHAKAESSGRYSLKTQKGQMKFNLQPIEFTAYGTQPHHLLPLLTGVLRNTSGTAGFTGEFSLPELKGSGTLLLKNISTEIDKKPVDKISAVLEIRRFAPLYLEHQEVAIAGFNPGIPLYDGVVSFSYNGVEALPLRIHHAEWRMAGGRVTTADVPINPVNPQATILFAVHDLSLQELLEMTRLDGLEVTGRVSGVLPLRIDGEEIFIENGDITATEPGIIRYSPDTPPAFLQSGHPQMTFVQSVINNFHYERLRFVINGQAGANQNIRLEALGRNPDLTETRPVALNLNLEGAIENILGHHIQAYTIPDNIHEQIRKYEEQNVTQP